MTDDVRAAGRPGRPGAHRARPGHDPVRVRRGRVRQDHPARRPGGGPGRRGFGDRVDRRHHVHGEGSRRVAPPRPGGAPATGRRRGGLLGALRHRPRRPRPGRPVHAALLRPAGAHRVPPRGWAPAGDHRAGRDRLRARLRPALPGLLRRAHRTARAPTDLDAGAGARHLGPAAEGRRRAARGQLGPPPMAREHPAGPTADRARPADRGGARPRRRLCGDRPLGSAGRMSDGLAPPAPGAAGGRRHPRHG